MKKNVLNYIKEPETLQGFRVTPNFSINVDEDVLNHLMLLDRPLEEIEPEVAIEEGLLSPIADSIGLLLGYIYDNHKTIRTYLQLQSIDYLGRPDGLIQVNFTWVEMPWEIPSSVKELIAEHDVTEVTLISIKEDRGTIEVSFRID
jgi:hypothetical protein